jgi:NADH:ubiquinone oxidoreductase subunit F (NADH-binding)
MSEFVLQLENSPGAIGANLVAFFIDANTQLPSFVGNDGVVHAVTITANNAVYSNTRNVYTKAQSVTPVALGSSGNTTIDANSSNTFEVVPLTGNIGLPNPANLSAGWTFTLLLKQGTAGNFTVTYGSQFKFANSGGANEKVLTVTANAVDVVSGYYSSAANIIVCGARQNMV